MKHILLQNDKHRVLSWCMDIEDTALTQIQDCFQHPRLFHSIAIMPDCHTGYGVPIGTVLPVTDAVIPNAVGVDIGCGMIACKLNLQHDDDVKAWNLELREWVRLCKQRIPMGTGGHISKQESFNYITVPNTEPVKNNLEASLHQLGTLGGGNHFIELQRDVEGYIWVMIHSGSRNFGYKIAQYYHNLAKDLCTQWDTPVTPELAYFPKSTPEYVDYMQSMNYACQYAKINRERLMEKVLEIVNDIWYGDVVVKIDTVHNFARLENHFGKNVVVHRKGAIFAPEGRDCIIPSSMGTDSYIVKGKGNRDSYNSASHGAGRVMSRKKAKETITNKNLLDIMGNIVYSCNSVDEAPQAYKDGYEVMQLQDDLVEITNILTPIACVKG